MSEQEAFIRGSMIYVGRKTYNSIKKRVPFEKASGATGIDTYWGMRVILCSPDEMERLRREAETNRGPSVRTA